jgi:outer membrane immunogenic protein
MKKLSLAAALVASVSVPAYAADVFEPLPPVFVEDEGSPWEGFHIGVIGGWAQSTIAGCQTTLLFYDNVLTEGFRTSEVQPPEECDESGRLPIPGLIPIYGYTEDFEFDQRGWLLGAQGGYTLAFGDSQFAFLLGGEVDAALADISGRLEHEGEIGLSGKATWNYLATGTVQAGVGFDMFKVYVEGGVAIGGLDFQGDFGCNFSDPQTGFVAGIGAAAMVLENVSLGVEYNHIWFQDSENHCAFGDGASEIHTAAEMDVIKASANVHF